VEQVDRAAAIIDHMRIFGRVPQGAPPMIDAAATCRSALELIGHQLRDSQISVSVRSGDCPHIVKCHPVLLEQVLVNLLRNARDAMVGVTLGTREICMEVISTDHEVIITVSDNGPGVPTAVRDRVFEPFFTTKSAEMGTGLGLSVSYGIIRDSGGKLELLARGPGCTFRISFPAMPVPKIQST
jgi:C4-dicarboxylate-specific signal transduction histidine kinase